MTVAAPTTRIPILFTGPNRAMVALGILPSHSYCEVTGDRLRVRLGWAFRMDAARDEIVGVAPDHGIVTGWGAHGWRGSWLVNGSSRNLVRVTFASRLRAKVCGVPVRVRRLRVSVTDPDALVGALGG